MLVSAAITRGTARSVVELAAGGSYVMVVCPHLVDELTVVLGRDRFLRWRTREQLDRFVADIVALADHTGDPDVVAAVTRDPNDDYLVALAVNSAAVICTATAISTPGPPRVHIALIDAHSFGVERCRETIPPRVL